MNTKKKKNKTWNLPIVMFAFFLICIFLLYLQFAYLALSNKVYGKDMDEFSAKRNTVKKVLPATRGTIYDSEDNVLALNVSSYTVIAYTNEKRSENSIKPLHVVDVDSTANALAPILEVDASYLKDILNKGKEKKVYQVELGSTSKGITELKKEEIEKLNLPGIDFIEDQKRYYPNGDFASYVVGYAKKKEVQSYDDYDKKVTKTEIVGELGIESKYDDLLKGTDGYLEYQQDRYGYKITGAKEVSIDALNGYDIHLTIDANIQRFLESTVKKIDSEYSPEWVTISVMDAKTGDILGTSSTPSFDPNKRNITNYENPLLSIAYEPGSTMKTYTYMCALEKGNYNGNDTYTSGTFKIGDDTVTDWNDYGWGTITFDKGYEYSSNVGVVNIMDRYLDKKDLRECLNKYGFGKKTNIELSREVSGSIKFNYPIEVATASFGQGITATPIQQLQALTLISNNGKMLTPHIVKKIEDPNTKKTYYKRKVEESEQLVKTSTVNKMKDLMYNVIQGTDPGSTGYPYRIDGFDVIGKTGTSQISENGKYIEGDNAYIFSFAGMYPKNDPEIIIYAAMKKPTWGKSSGLSTNVKDLMKSIAKYKKMFTEVTNNSTLNKIKVKSYTSKKVENVKQELEVNGINVLVLGNGDRVVRQSVKKGTSIVSGDRIILMTNDEKYTMPDITGWSRMDAISLCDMLKIKYNVEGYGYVESQSLGVGSEITDNSSINITLKEKYDIQVNKEN